MTNKNISGLTGATTPLAGTELVPVWDGATKKVSVANLTAGRAVTAARIDTSNNAGGGSMSSFTNGWANTTIELLGSGTTGDGIINIKNPASTVGFGLEVQSNGTKIARIDSTGNYIPIAAKGINFTANTPAAGMTSQLLNWYEEGTFTPNQGAGLTVIGAFVSDARYTKVGRLVTIQGYLAGATSIAVSGGGTLFSNAPFTTGITSSGSLAAYANVGNSTCVITNGSTNVLSNTAIGPSSYLLFNVTYSV